MDELARMADLKRRFTRRHWASQTWSQRMADLDRHQEETWNAMCRSPAGFAHFLRRNFKKRAVVVTVPDVE